jgi:hypothetical protein
MNLTELGEITDSTYDQEHRCDQNELPDCDRLLHCVSRHDEPHSGWELHMLHFAEKEEVDIGEAEYEGQLTYHSLMRVNYCPFCGEKLQPKI